MYRASVVIESKPTLEGEKTRQFHAEVLAWVQADTFWELGGGKERVLRPALLAYAATDQSARSFTANLRTGRTAAEIGHGSLRIELPRSAGFRFETHSADGGTLTLAYLPSLFSRKPGTEEQGVLSFLCMPTTWWLDEQEARLKEEFGGDARAVARAAYFVSYLDQRCPLPIVNDLRFHLALFNAATSRTWFKMCDGEVRDFSLSKFKAAGLRGVGFDCCIACSVTLPEFSDFLAEQTAKHVQKRQVTTHVTEARATHGETRIRSARRLLPDAGEHNPQLGLFDFVRVQAG